MRRRVSFIVAGAALATVFPMIAMAAASVSSANVGASVPADARACILKLFQAQDQKKVAQGKPADASVDGLTDNCTIETINIDATGKKTIIQTGRNGNNDTKDPKGCIANSCSSSQCANVTLNISIPGIASPTKTISKCDPNYQKDLSAASGNSATEMNNFALKSIAQTAIQNANPSTVSGQEQLSQALQNFGVSQKDANDVVVADKTNGTNNAQDLLKSFVSGDTAQISQAANTAGITLNADTVSSITSLSPSDVSRNVSNLYNDNLQHTANVIADSSSTFAPSNPNSSPQALRGGQYAGMFNDLEQKYNLPSGYMASVAKIESGGNASICSGGQACGMFQYTQGTWAIDSQRYNAQVNGINAPMDQNLRFDPTTEANVTAYTASYYKNTYGNTINNAVAAGMDPNAALYSLHNLGPGGGQAFMTAYAQNPNQPVSNVVSGSAIAGNPGLYGNGNISLAQAQQNMLGAMGGNTNFTAGASPLGGVQSPLTAVVAQNGQIYYVNTGESPFSGVSNIYTTPGLGSSPYGYNQYGQYGQYGQQYNQYGQQIQPIQTASNPIQTQTNSTSQERGTTAPNPTTTPTPSTTPAPASTPPPTGQTGTAVAQIIVQPHVVSSGGVVSVSWSSAGMSSDTPCKVRENGVGLLSSTNEGAQSITASSTGKLTFSLTCTAQSDGQIIKSSASVLVQ